MKSLNISLHCSHLKLKKDALASTSQVSWSRLAFIEDSLQRCSKQVFSVASEPTYHAAQTMYDIPKGRKSTELYLVHVRSMGNVSTRRWICQLWSRHIKMWFGTHISISQLSPPSQRKINQKNLGRPRFIIVPRHDPPAWPRLATSCCAGMDFRVPWSRTPVPQRERSQQK